MTSMLRYLFGRCLPYPVGLQRNVNEHTDDPNIHTLHFVVPREDYEKFARMKPDDEFLTVSQYMFLYKYMRNVEQIKAPGPDYDSVSYLFGDGILTMQLKGWVPSKAPKSDNFGDVVSRLHEAKSCLVGAEHPRRASAYNWGIINTWSHHCAETSGANVPVPLFSLTRSTGGLVLNSDFVLYVSSLNHSQQTQDSDRRVDNTANRRVGSVVITRDRKLRPKGTKGRRIWNRK